MTKRLLVGVSASNREAFKQVEYAQALERATQRGLELFKPDPYEDKWRNKSGLLSDKLRRQNSEGEWERRCRCCAEYLPEAPEFFVRSGKLLRWICQDCMADRYAESHSASSRKRRAIKRGVETERITTKDVQGLWDKQEGKCFYCGCKLNMASEPLEGTRKYQIDHYIPISKGGGHILSNLVLACADCNQKKYDLMPDEFLKLIAKEV